MRTTSKRTRPAPDIAPELARVAEDFPNHLCEVWWERSFSKLSKRTFVQPWDRSGCLVLRFCRLKVLNESIDFMPVIDKFATLIRGSNFPLYIGQKPCKTPIFF